MDGGFGLSESVLNALMVFALIGFAAVLVAVPALIWWLIVHVRWEWVG